MTNAPTTPSLYDLIASIQKQITQIASETHEIKIQNDSIHANLAKRRFSRKAPATAGVLNHEFLTNLEAYYEETREPMQLYFLTRRFARKIEALGTNALTLIQSNPDIKSYVSGIGGVMLLPMRVWKTASDDQQMHWLSRTPKDIQEKRRNLHEATGYFIANAQKRADEASKKLLTPEQLPDISAFEGTAENESTSEPASESDTSEPANRSDTSEPTNELAVAAATQP